VIAHIDRHNGDAKRPKSHEQKRHLRANRVLFLPFGQPIDSINDRPQCPYLSKQGASSYRGDRYPCSGAASLDTLLDLDERCLFEDSEVLGEVPTGQTQGLEQVSELHAACLMDEAEDAEASPLMDDFVESLCRV